MKQTKRFNYTSPIKLIICRGGKCSIYILLTNIQNVCSVQMWNFNSVETPLTEDIDVLSDLHQLQYF